MKKAKQDDTEWERLLKIRTGGRDDSISNQVNYPYEPTDYKVLNRLAVAGYIGRNNTLLDYGCGKGRVSFFMAYQTRCRAIGIDYDERMISSACHNRETAVSGHRTAFLCANAAGYDIPSHVDRIYFFNPFSVEILSQVLYRIRESYETSPREILLFFYYPSGEYMGRLMQEDDLMFYDEIDCQDLYDGQDDREKIVIFKLGD